MAWRSPKVALTAAFVAVLIGIFAWLPRTAQLSPDSMEGEGCLVLVYHRVQPRSWAPLEFLAGQDDFSVYADDFDRHMTTLKADGAQFIKPEDLESIIKRKTPAPQKCVLVTLDDGDSSQYRYAYPILKKERIPFVLFVISGRVGAKNYKGLEMVTWPQIREMMLSQLITIGSHTHDMHEMENSRQPIFMNPANTGKFAEDLQLSLSTIQRELGTPSHYFAYPFGYGIPQTDAIVLHNGQRLIFSLREGLVKPGDPSFFVKRVMVTPRNWHLIENWFGKTK